MFYYYFLFLVLKIGTFEFIVDMCINRDNPYQGLICNVVSEHVEVLSEQVQIIE
jgi:hypothetical protein